MRLDHTGAERAFRHEVRRFCAQNLPSALRERVRSGMRAEPEGLRQWQNILFRQGWGAPTWPREYGGTGWSPVQIHIFEQETAAADAPPQFHQGLELIGPIIFTYGTEEQKAKYLPRILSGEDWWCQGYSEPQAGSDLAGLRTRAVRDGDHYVVSGQKLWTSYAHVADRMFCLVRTSNEARKQEGISLLLIDMDSPGITVRPFQTLDEQAHVTEVFLDAVRVPESQRVGEEGKGWSYGKVLLDRERALTAALGLRISRLLEHVRALALKTPDAGTTLYQSPLFRAKFAQLEIEVQALEHMGLRMLADNVAGVDTGPRGSMLKLRWSELLQRASELWTEALGYDGTCFAPAGPLPGWVPQAQSGPVVAYLHSRVTSIYGGSNEIQRNIIARRALGL
ncbi:MAG: acyl-CoA dehydrogenase family protein [Acidovorax sp.]|jgi:alkylation response protein AidB-like acyl-CoA dehydrogenase|nr:acyl-CoA dehydrogenase family protein [Acidovorax sp.]